MASAEAQKPKVSPIEMAVRLPDSSTPFLLYLLRLKSTAPSSDTVFDYL